MVWLRVISEDVWAILLNGCAYELKMGFQT